MNRNMQEKIELEHQAARLFMRLYEQKFGIPMRHIWHNEPKKPDVSCYLDDQRLDLEIAHLYGSEAEAKLILGREANIRTLEALHRLIEVPVDQRLLNALNAILASKAEKSYHSDRVWLVLRNANPLWSRQDFATNLHQVTLPVAHPFEQIWVIGDMKGLSGILRLFP
ncbi:hypothetical protein Q9L42_008175 [Methylomarinum sp. Ch1-1]|uniref:Orphan protein n=1 Tax=Methylomarinum roseum TaxID=3067653 RepID=A0AAU7NZW5_9GAMM|nr:hypothetical protein [Methylomarinum sp. Ch1-1]MDP4521804.1 hypothetical protein [Methylomarinum sp. Ch1-1]